MSRAQEVFNKLQSEGISYVNWLISNQVPEELFLDYKLVSTQNLAGKLADPDKRNLSKAISGFGNSDGGVVIWGVDCRNIPGVGDVPAHYQAEAPNELQGFSPIWLKSTLEGLTGGATLPPHQGVQHLPIDRLSKGDGVVATYVPAGLGVPYRTVYDGKGNYYIRSGSDFNPAPHGVLAALFGQRPQPVIQLSCRLRPRDAGTPPPTSDNPLWVQLEVVAKNVGRGMAEDMFFIVEPHSTPFKCMPHRLKTEEWQIDEDKQSEWEGLKMAVTRPSRRRLPPGATFTLTLELVAKRPPCDFWIDITGGFPGGPSDMKTIFVKQSEIDEAFSAYSETPLNSRHSQHVMDVISRNLKSGLR